MVKQQVMFTFPQERIESPIIHTLGVEFNVVTNIRRADITADKGWVLLELEGDADQIERGLEWVTSRGVRVDPIIGDVVEG